MVDEFSRSPRASSSRLYEPTTDLPKSPRQTSSRGTPSQLPEHQHQHRGQRVHSPGPVSRRDHRPSEYSRGPPPSDGTQRILFDPKHPTPTPPSASTSASVSASGLSRHTSSSRPETPPSIPRHPDDDRRRTTRRPEGSSARQLFDPTQHDPIQFHGRLDAPSLNGSGHGSSRSFPRVRSKEEEMDRERERRKRKEGSERGMAKKKDHSDSKSKGSRSSEGSFKDRERGKGKA